MNYLITFAKFKNKLLTVLSKDENGFVDEETSTSSVGLDSI